MLRGRATLAQLLAPFRIETVGRDALVGLEAPFVLAVNEAGRLDQQILALALPRRLRPALRRPSSALSRGRNVVVFSNDPEAGRSVGEFDTTAAELAAQHGVPVVPVGIVGSYRLPDTLQLKLTTRPLVSVRFGSPVRARNRSLEEVTEELQSRVEHLVGEGTLSWWEVERRRGGAPADDAPPRARWIRLWQQGAPRAEARARRIWR